MDEVVHALEGAIAPMECFVHDHTERVLCSHEPDAGHGGADRAAVDSRRGRNHSLAADDHAGGVGRVRAPSDERAFPAGPETSTEMDMAELEIRNLHVRAGERGNPARW